MMVYIQLVGGLTMRDTLESWSHFLRPLESLLLRKQILIERALETPNEIMNSCRRTWHLLYQESTLRKRKEKHDKLVRITEWNSFCWNSAERNNKTHLHTEMKWTTLKVCDKYLWNFPANDKTLQRPARILFMMGCGEMKTHRMSLMLSRKLSL